MEIAPASNVHERLAPQEHAAVTEHIPEVHIHLPLHGEIGHVCTPECQHSQAEADALATELFGDIVTPSHGEAGHVCDAHCRHNQQEADAFADTLFADIFSDEKSVHMLDAHEHGDPEHICTAECRHSQIQADAFAEDLFADTVKLTHSEQDHVCDSECQHSQASADQFAEVSFSRVMPEPDSNSLVAVIQDQLQKPDTNDDQLLDTPPSLIAENQVDQVQASGPAAASTELKVESENSDMVADATEAAPALKPIAMSPPKINVEKSFHTANLLVPEIADTPRAEQPITHTDMVDTATQPEQPPEVINENYTMPYAAVQESAATEVLVDSAVITKANEYITPDFIDLQPVLEEPAERLETIMQDLVEMTRVQLEPADIIKNMHQDIETSAAAEMLETVADPVAVKVIDVLQNADQTVVERIEQLFLALDETLDAAPDANQIEVEAALPMIDELAEIFQIDTVEVMQIFAVNIAGSMDRTASTKAIIKAFQKFMHEEYRQDNGLPTLSAVIVQQTVRHRFVRLLLTLLSRYPAQNLVSA